MVLALRAQRVRLWPLGGVRPHGRREVLSTLICRPRSELDKTGCDQCTWRFYGILNEQGEVAERTVGGHRLLGSDLRTLP
jgi:hypothetical protein